MTAKPGAVLMVLLLTMAACSSGTDVAEQAATPTLAPTSSPTPDPTTGPDVEETPPGEPTPTSAVPAVAEFSALNAAEGYGFLRLMTLEERPNPLDVVVYRTLPNELPRVAGVITAVPQTPLSHVNLRAVQDNVPNAYVEDALTNATISNHVGTYVRYTVTSDGFVIEPATQAEVELHHAAARPTEAQTPQRDLSVTAIAPLAELGFEDSSAYGVKTANLATLLGLDLPEASVPSGFGVPFSFYDEFMEANGFYDQVSELLADPEFQSDPEIQDQELEALRDAIKDAPMSASALAALDSLQDSFPDDTSLRCRSSTNNEDLPNFSGAGLYDSRTQHPDEGHMSKCIKQVFASVWNLRAFWEREFYRIDHLATAMGVLVHPNFSDEQANGVAVTFDPVFETPDVYYVNSQLGEDLVTNPEALSVPEAVLLGGDGSIAGVITRSNLAEPGEFLLTDQQFAALQSSLSLIHDEFASQYQVGEQDRFAIEIEFKITADAELAIKQARPWIFNESTG